MTKGDRSLTMSLLRTKLLPPQQTKGAVQRTRLLDRLDQGLAQGRRLTLVSAEAGAGKTTLLADWIHRRLVGGDRGLGWLALDRADNEPARFLTYLLAALQRAAPSLDDSLLAAVNAPQPHAVETVLTALINQLAEMQTPLLLFLDDYHLIEAAAIHRALVFLHEHQPANLHLVLASRADPPLPLSRLRARNQLTELRAADLHFSIEEATDFLNRMMGLHLAVSEIAALETRTEGWVAGLQMAALSIQDMTQESEIAAFIADFAGSNRYIFDYLTDEVLAQRPPEIQSFLLQTAILDRFNATLCTAVTGNPKSQYMLQTLERANLFLIPLDDNRQWYRYHHLFDDLLKQRLFHRPKIERDSLHLKAAQWFEANGLVDEAIRHYKEADGQEQIAGLIKQYGFEALQPGQLYRLREWLDALSGDRVRADVWLALLRAWIGYFEQRPEQVAIWVEHGFDRLQNTDDRPRRSNAQLRGSLVGLRSWLASQQGDFRQAIGLAEEALAILPETDPVWRGIVYIFLGQALFGDGRTAEAIAVYETSLQFNNEASNWVATAAISDAIMMTITFRGHLSEARVRFDRIIATVTGLGQSLNASNLRIARLAILYEQNDLATMGSELAELRRMTQYDAGIATMRYTYLSALHDTASGERERALNTLALIERDASSWTTPDEQARAFAAAMRIYLRLGERQKPLTWLESITIDRSNLTLLRITEYLAVADILRFSVSKDEQRNGLELIAAVHQLCEAAGMVGFKIEVYCLQALLLAVIKNMNEALVALRYALALGGPEHYVRTFVDFGQPMAALLKKAVRREIHPQYAGFLLTQFAPDKEARRGSTKPLLAVDPLSDRELEVLALLTTHLTGPEIAGRLHISYNTFKTHTKNIYSKLGISSRAAAVTQAQEQGLLPR